MAAILHVYDSPITMTGKHVSRLHLDANSYLYEVKNDRLSQVHIKAISRKYVLIQLVEVL